MSTGALAKALAKAQEKAKAVPHDSQNDYHKYWYTSAEAVIGEAKQALAGCGLAILPLSQELAASGERVDLHRTFVLLHESGEERTIFVAVPVIPERGRPLDKAVAGASTTSLSYLLRDLLLMPRVDPDDDLAGREDRDPPAPQRQPAPRPTPPPQKPAAPPAAAPAKPAQPREPLSVRLAAKDAALAQEGVCSPGTLLAYLRDMLPAEGMPTNVDDIHPDDFAQVGKLVKQFEAEARAAAAAEIPI